MKTTTYWIIALLLFASSTTLLAQNINKPAVPIAYYINIPGQQLNNGYYSPARTIPVEQLAKEDYLSNQIHLKLKVGAQNKFLPGNQVQTDPLQASLKKINTTSINSLEGDLKIAPEKDIYGVGRIYEITYSTDKDPYEVCKELIKNPDVEYAIPVFKRYSFAFTPNDPQYASQWALTKIKATEAWDISKGDTSVVIAIVDVGSDWQHNDLSANIWINRQEIPNNGIDDDLNGKIDDIHGWDFVGNVTATDIQQANWKEDNDPKNAAQNHGTHTAGCASAVTNNGTGVAGIGFNCRIMPLKCGSDVSTVAGIYRGYTAILYAAQMGADIISCSWGGPGFSLSEEDIMKQATEMGSLVVAASGNDGKNTDLSPYYPTCYDNIMSVGSTGSTDAFSTTSNFGSKVTVYAPGENILSTTPNNTYTSLTGTSMSCPIAAGLAGLVKSVHPDWTPAQIQQQIRVTTDNVLASANQAYRYLYWGRINALKALQYNNPSFPANVIPGFKINSFSISGDDALRNYDQVNIKLSLKNYLSKTDSVKVSFQPLSNYISVSNKDFWIYNLASLDTTHIDLWVQLLANNPWFDGKAQLQVTYSSAGYTDIQIVEIPIKIISNNIFAAKGYVNTTIYPQWDGVSSPDKETAWGVGNSQLFGAIYFKNNSLGFTANRVSTGLAYITDPLYCISSYDETLAIAGTGKGYLLRTDNSGTTWTNISVSLITDFTNALLFKDQNNGLMLGDPKNNRWGIALTSDNGQSWTLVNNVPAPLTGETGYVESVYQDYESVWFGTSSGRIFFSSDFGKTWRVNTVYSGGTIVKMAFYDTLHGVTAYTEASGTNQTLYLANTSDGGKTWNKRVNNLTQNGLYPLNLFCLPHTKRIMAVFSSGIVMTTSDLGQTWIPVLSKQSVYYEAAKPFVDGKSVRIWEAGDYINTLDFDYEYDSGMEAVSPVINISAGVNVFPVPAYEIIHINCNLIKGEETDIQLLDITGRIIRQVYKGVSAGGYHDYNLQVTDITPGIYFVKVQSSGSIKTLPIVISK
jgi:subtilisin family serine protease/photosystem II stability/assembly factor-like uncharacterized protein